MIHGVLFSLSQLGLALVFFVAAYGFGSALLATLHLEFTNSGERWLFSQTIGLGVLSILLLGLGALGLYEAGPAWVLIGLGIVLFIWRALKLLPGRTWSIPSWRPTDLPLLSLGLLSIIVLSFGYTLSANALTPPVEYDVIAYHFAIPKLYLQAHRIIYIPYMVYSNWPLGTEMLYTLGLLLGSEFLPQLITWGFALLIAVGLIVFAHERLLPRTGLLAATLFSIIPMVGRIAGTGLIEIPLACHSFFALYALWRWHELARPNHWLLVSALMGGLAASSKLNGAAVPIVIGVAAMLLEFATHRPARAMRVFLLYGVVSFLVVLPWYAKTWFFTGDPLWPFLQSWLGARDWDMQGTTYLVGYIRSTNLGPTFQNWLLGLWYVTTDNAGKFGSYLLGPYLLALMPLAILPVLFVRRIRPLVGLFALVSAALYSVWFLLTHQSRFLMPALPAMALLAAVGVAWLWQLPSRAWRRAIQVGVLILLFAGTWIFDPSRRANWSVRMPFLAGAADRASYLTSIYPDYPVFEYANQNLPSNARVILLPQDVRGYYLDRPYIWANPISQRFLRLDQFSDSPSLFEALRRMGITHVFLNTEYTVDFAFSDHDNRLVAGLVDTYGRLMMERGPTRLYELH